MKKTALLLALGGLALAQPAFAQSSSRIENARPGSVDVQGCAQGQNTNKASANQTADRNVFGCVQAGQDNSVDVKQSGSKSNTARVIQGEAPKRN